MSRRSKAREAVFQILYQDDLSSKTSPSVGEDLLARRLRDDESLQFARSLLAGVRRNREELDARLEATADNWSVGRMAPTDRNALRIGAYEILYADTPDTVAVDEAIELAKRYGTAQSAGFVNGILDRLMHGRGEAASSDDKKTTAQPPAADASADESDKVAPESLNERALRLKARKN